jgi:hypothetical protein
MECNVRGCRNRRVAGLPVTPDLRRLRHAADRLRRALMSERSRDRLRTHHRLARTLADTERMLTVSPVPSAFAVSRQVRHVDRVLAVWEALLAF